LQIQRTNGYRKVIKIFCQKPKYHPSTDILRETQISNILKILQILYGYLELIAFLIGVSNWMPVKCGLEKI
jgi:hypothetical protein